MATVIQSEKQIVRVNGADLYCEVSGSGPAVLLIAGGSGDSGHFDRFKGDLTTDLTVITYDRRGAGRSPWPANLMPTSIPQHADDAAGLAETLGIAPVAIFGTSMGANIALELLLRHATTVLAAVLHEPSIPAITAAYYEARGLGPGFTRQRDAWMASVQRAVVEKGPAGALEAFFMPIVGETTWRQIDPEVMARAVANAESMFTAQASVWQDYFPLDAAVEAIRRPVTLLRSAESPAELFEGTAAWLGDRGFPVRGTLPGGHAAYIDRPKEFAAALRPYLLKAVAAQP